VTADLRPSGAPATTEEVGEAVVAAIGHSGAGWTTGPT
jgi:hypothetical protein